MHTFEQYGEFAVHMISGRGTGTGPKMPTSQYSNLGLASLTFRTVRIPSARHSGLRSVSANLPSQMIGQMRLCVNSAVRVEVYVNPALIFHL